MVFQDADFQTWSAQGFATGDAPDYEYTLVNPVSITKMDASGKVLEQISAVRESTSGKLESADSFPQSSYRRWTTYQYTDCCLAASQRLYHDIPISGIGSPGTNYDETDYGYDVMKRQNRTVTPGGTITYKIFDTRGQMIAGYIGTNDNGATDQDPTGGGAMGNNMVLVTSQEYDNGEAGGDGNLTLLTQHVDAMTARLTAYLYDWRDRQMAIDGEIDFYEQVCYDNLDRTIRIDRRDTTAAGNLIGRSETQYDDQGRVSRSIRYGVDPTTGTVGYGLSDNTWYDASGHVIKLLPSGSKRFTKTSYDSLSRATIKYLGYGLDETSYGEAGNVTDDVIMEQSETSYDAASNVIQSTQRLRYHSAPDTQTGPLQNPSSTPKARILYFATYPDGIGRGQATANYGTNGGTALSRPSTIPTRSDTILVSSTGYDSAGDILDTTDAAGIETRNGHDDLGRQVEQITNYVESSSSSSSSPSSSSSSSDDCEPSADQNVTTLITYNADGNVSTITAVNAYTGNQTTQYDYGTTLSDSGIATSTLKRKETHPDSTDDNDVILFEYNRQQQVTQITDQAGTVRKFDIDLLGRQTQDRVTIVGTGVDGTIRRIETSFDVRGMNRQLATYDDPSPGSGAVVNECQYRFNDFGQLIAEYQSHSGVVNMSLTPKVEYGYATGSTNTIRVTSLTYPDGRVIDFDYGTAGSMADALSRIETIKDGSTALSQYSYLGIGTFVVTDYTEPDIKWTMVDLSGTNDPDSGDMYSGFDRFGRVKDNRWYNYGTTEDTDRCKYGYDRNGNRTSRENLVATTFGAKFDEKYLFDMVNRLKHLDRGQLTSLKDAITDKSFSQCWQLDATGNWKTLRQDDDGDGSWDLNQNRMVNTVNEITNINNTVGSSWVTPAYSRSGNMITIPKPSDPTQSYTATYDAWNRLIRIEVSVNIVAEYEHDGARRRTVEKSYTAGVLSEVRHFFYTEPSKWQVIEERTGTSPDTTTSERQFVYGLRYIDDLVHRDRDTTGNEALDERLYVLSDANWNVTAITNAGGITQERYAYAAYGIPQFLTSSFGDRADSSYDWELLYSGYLFNDDTGLYQVRYRVLHSLLGTWLQRDPLPQPATFILSDSSFAQGVAMERLISFHHKNASSKLEYVGSQPLTFVDPLGLAQFSIGGLIFYVHPNDVDPFPSNPHAHLGSPNTPVKIDLNDGQIFNGGKPTGKFLNKKILAELRRQMTQRGLLCIGFALILLVPEVLQAGQQGGAAGIAQLGGDFLIDAATGTVVSVGTGYAITTTAGIAGTSVTVGGVSVTGLAATTGVGAAVIVTAGGGYAIGTAIGQIQVGEQTVHEGLGNGLYWVCPSCWNW